MRLAALLAAAALMGVAVSATVAWAVTVPDRDDVGIGLDLSKASGTHNRASDELVHTIDTYGPFAPADLASPKGKPPASVCFEIWTTNKPGEAPANYEACATADARAKAWKGGVARLRQKGPRLRVAAATVAQPSPTRLVVRFKPDAIRRPASYRWRAEATVFSSGCQSPNGCHDFAPDRPEIAATKLSSPRR